jgi:hypothetical protein
LDKRLVTAQQQSIAEARPRPGGKVVPVRDLPEAWRERFKADLGIVPPDDIFRKERDLPASSGGIDDVGGDGVARRMSAQSADDLKPFFDRRPEVR